MLVVLVIVAIVLGLAMPAFEKITVGTGVNAGSRAITGQLRLARQYAIANRKKIAVIMPAADFDKDRLYTSMRACQQSPSTGNYTWVPETNWEFLPTGAVVHSIANGETVTVDPDDAAGTAPNPADVRAIIFKPTGAVQAPDPNSTVVIHLKEGFYDGSAVQVRGEGKNAVDVAINPYTGRISVETP